jgi:dUTP pyrophosphatase
MESASNGPSFFPKLKIKKLSEKAQLPVKGSEHAAGYDLMSTEEVTVPARGKAVIPTGLAMAIPIGNYGRIAPRSGLAAKNFIDVGAGVIDADYRGEVKVLLFNFSEVDFKVSPGDRIAQFIIEKYTRTEIEEVTDGEDLNSTERGEGGFGSTGVQGALSQSKKRDQPEISAK